MRQNIITRFVLISLAAGLLSACSPVRDIRFRAHYHDANDLLYAAAQESDLSYLKAHLKDGGIVLFSESWDVDMQKEIVTGDGQHFDFNRRFVRDGEMVVSVDSVVIFETNKMPKNNDQSRISSLSVLGGLNTALGIYCLAVPKACFGSCPTFYLDGDQEFHYARAEGFSNAIAPGLEYTDIDALNIYTTTGGTFPLTMKNEAYETHNVRSLKLLAVPREEDQRVYHTQDDKFYLARQRVELTSARSGNDDVTYLLNKDDQAEYFSLADPDNLRSTEEVFLQFDNPGNIQQLGLVAGFRQSLMTTYLLYNAFDHMGNLYGDLLATVSIAEDDAPTIADVLYEQLGGISAYLRNSHKNEWVYQGTWYETGPIAINHQLMLLDAAHPEEEIHIKLEMNRGMWRLDYLHLTEIIEKVVPLEIKAERVYANKKHDEDLLQIMLDGDAYLVSQPGDTYRFEFELPAIHDDYELFLSATGFYMVWGREEWQKEKDLYSLYMMRHHPGRYLKKHAQAYKEYEKVMEEAFWGSRVKHQIISGHDK